MYNIIIISYIILNIIHTTLFVHLDFFRGEVLFSVTPHPVTLNIVDDDAVLFFVCLLLFLFFSQFDL